MYARGMSNYIRWPICGLPSQSGMALTGTGLSGLRGLGCACGCGTCESKGLGYFDTGWDISGWSWMEWGTVLIGAYIVMSTLTTTQRGAKRVTGSIRKARRRSTAKRRERLERELEAL